ncbi:unnamed protein product [Pylaiella littoralis]
MLLTANRHGLRVEDRGVTVEEMAKVWYLLMNLRLLAQLKNEGLRDPCVYRGRKDAEDLDYAQFRSLAGAAIMPKSGLHSVYDAFGGDLGAMEKKFGHAAEGGLASFMNLLRSKGGDGRVLEDHPVFPDATTWDRPVLNTQGMCLQGGKRAFFHEAPTRVTGKTAKACDDVSPFDGGPVSKMNRTLTSCIKIVTDSDGSAIPHCAAVKLVRPELRETAEIVEVAWMQAVLHNFPKSPVVGVFRGGDIAEAGRAANTVQQLAAVGDRNACVCHGNHSAAHSGRPKPWTAASGEAWSCTGRARAGTPSRTRPSPAAWRISLAESSTTTLRHGGGRPTTTTDGILSSWRWFFRAQSRPVKRRVRSPRDQGKGHEDQG